MKNKYFLGGFSLLVLIVVVVFFNMKSKSLKTIIKIADQEIRVEVASSPEEMAQGLIGVSYLGDNEGMLFPYATEQEVKFWMKDMKMAIDLIWIKDNEVIDFEKNMQPDNGQKLYFSPGPIDKVLELRSGWIEEYGLKLGDKLQML